jgi:hypothetical protein
VFTEVEQTGNSARRVYSFQSVSLGLTDNETMQVMMEVWNKERNVAECFVVMPKKDALFALVGFAVAPQLPASV